MFEKYKESIQKIVIFIKNLLSNKAVVILVSISLTYFGWLGKTNNEILQRVARIEERQTDFIDLRKKLEINTSEISNIKFTIDLQRQDISKLQDKLIYQIPKISDKKKKKLYSLL